MNCPIKKEISLFFGESVGEVFRVVAFYRKKEVAKANVMYAYP